MKNSFKYSEISDPSMDSETKIIAPFIVKPLRINNYAHLITNLKLKQNKYSGFVPQEPICHRFSKCLSSKVESLNLDEILQGFLHEKCKDKLDEFEKLTQKNLIKSCNSRLEELRKERDLNVYEMKIGNTSPLEDLFFAKPGAYSFGDDLLFDLYEFLCEENSPIKFLYLSYLKLVKRYFPKEKDNFLITKAKIQEFVKLKFDKQTFNIEVYESRYVWAELFVAYRIGRIDLVREILNEFEVLFKFMSSEFKSTFTRFLDSQKSNFIGTPALTDDKFKKFFYHLIENKLYSDGYVISSVEDYLWLKLVTNKEIQCDLKDFESPKVKLMVALFSKNYDQAINVLLKSNFSVVAKFFFLRKLCLGQHSSSTQTTLEASDHINPVFLNFLFILASKFSKNDQRVKIIELLKSYPAYYTVVPEYIIKFGLYDLLRSPDSSNDVEYSLDNTMSSRVLDTLRDRGDKLSLIKVAHLIDDIGMLNLLVQIVEESILLDEVLNVDLVEKYISKSNLSMESEKLADFYNFYKFGKNPTLQTLSATALFNMNKELGDYRFVVEKLLNRIIEVIKAENDPLMAETFFGLCGKLGLSEETSSKVSRGLAVLL